MFTESETVFQLSHSNMLLFDVKANKSRILIIKSFFVLALSIGFPVVPVLNLPFILFIIPFYLKDIYKFINHFSFASLILVSASFSWVILSFFVYNGVDDLFFSIKILIKIYLSVFLAIIVARELSSSLAPLQFWLIFQSIIILISVYSRDFYDLLILFISGGSQDVFSHIYGIRAIGFGIYHVDGAILISFLSFYLIYTSRNHLFSASSLGWLLSPLMSRTSILVIIPLMFAKSIKLSILTLSLLILFAISLDESYGALYWALELFRNVAIEGKFETVSTNANLNMFIWPGGQDFLFGHGRFFGDDNLFYQHTDLGIFRLIWFGGFFYVCLFFVLNNIYLARLSYKRSIFFIYLIVFLFSIIFNMKGLFVSSFYTVFFAIHFSFSKNAKL